MHPAQFSCVGIVTRPLIPFVVNFPEEGSRHLHLGLSSDLPTIKAGLAAGERGNSRSNAKSTSQKAGTAEQMSRIEIRSRLAPC